MSIRLKLKLFIASLFLAAIGNAIFSFKLEGYGEEKLKWVNHTHQVIIETELFLSALKDTETGQRGYLLTNDTSYLEPYYSGVINAKNQFEKLKTLTIDNSIQQNRLNSLAQSLKLKFSELAGTIELQNNKQDNKALEIVKQNRGKKYMDDIRHLLNQFIKTEMLLLEKRKGDFRENRAQITTLITVEIMFFIFLSILTLQFLNKNLFTPLHDLLISTRKIEKGENLEITDIVQKDEMGYLLSSFFKMSEIVNERTEQLEYKANHDELTNLPNRVKLFDEILNYINNSKKTNTKMAVLFLDLNKFKTLNDSMGHDAGDAMLIETANRLSHAIRSDDIVFRTGGDEFIAIIQNFANKSQIEKIVLNILSAFESPMIIKGKTIKISISIGVAIAPDNSINPDELIKMSDIAMYESKSHIDTPINFFDQSMLKRSSD
ncbi:MAG: diguanylate cyclase [Gammaproteobacteria bacterium]|nr:diguanylate cyclase [Gammaproteobacteria bacterium]